jgi:hypothetical protein
VTFVNFGYAFTWSVKSDGDGWQSRTVLLPISTDVARSTTAAATPDEPDYPDAALTDISVRKKADISRRQSDCFQIHRRPREEPWFIGQ